MDKQTKNSTLFNIVQLLYNWRAFLISYFAVLAIVTVFLVLIIPKSFSSRSTILPQTTSSLASLLPASMTTGLGGAISALTSDPGSDTFKIMSILKSRSFADSVVNRFNLQELFELPTIEDAVLQYREMVNITIDEEMMINVATITTTKFFHFENDEVFTKNMALEMNSYIIDELERRFTLLNTEKARFERITVENRLNQNILELNQVEIEIKNFTLENGLIALPEQMEALVQNMANLEYQIQIQQVELSIIKNSVSNTNSEVLQKERLISELSNQLNSLVNDNDANSLLPSFNSVPDLALKYAQLLREQEIQSLLYAYLFQQYEQLKIQEVKDTPSLQYIDTPVLPTKRISPTRSITAILIFITGAVLGVLYIILFEEYHNNFKYRIAELIN